MASETPESEAPVCKQDCDRLEVHALEACVCNGACANVCATCAGTPPDLQACENCVTAADPAGCGTETSQCSADM